MNINHTPGPWVTDGDYISGGRVPTEICNTIPAGRFIREHRSGAECRANARLIAQAPEMLSLLQEISSEWQDQWETGDDDSTLAHLIRSIPAILSRART